MEKSQKILLISTIVLVGFVVAVIFHYVLGFYMGLGYSFNTFLSEPNRAFDDFTAILPRIKEFAPYSLPANFQNYFPLAYIILMPFAYMQTPILAFVIFALGFIGFFLFFNIKSLKCENFGKIQNFKNIFIMTFLTYPFLCLMDRGNFDMGILVILTGFTYAFYKKNYKIVAILLGISNALKPYSFVFLILFLFEKKYKEFFGSIILSFLLILGGFFLFKGGLFNQLSIMSQCYVYCENLFILNPTNGFSNSSSLFMALKFIFCSFNNIISIQSLLEIYKYIVAVFTIGTIFFAWREKIFWKRFSILTLYMLIVPHLVFDYKLIFLFIPLWFFINAEEKSKFDKFYAILFALLLIPKRYIILFNAVHGFNLILFSTVINPLLMLSLAGLIIFERFNFRKIKNEEIN